MVMEMSCALTSSLEAPEHVRIAEQLGYRRAWLYDSPALYGDVWVQLCRAADRTDRIGLATGVMIPSMRHPMSTAAAIATLVSIAGTQRVAIGVGSGFTGRVAMGQRPMRWSDVENYVRMVQALLRGERVTIDGAVTQMLHVPGDGPDRPIEVPWLFAVGGPKGIGVARRAGAGVFGAMVPIPDFEWSNVLTFGTVLDDGEDPGSERVVDAAGHAAALLYHVAAEFGGTGDYPGLDDVPGGREWEAVYDAIPADIRHLALHEGHLSTVNERDRPFVSGELLAGSGLALDREGWREKLEALEGAGATEVSFQPAGGDIARELEAFADVAGAR